MFSRYITRISASLQRIAPIRSLATAQSGGQRRAAANRRPTLFRGMYYNKDEASLNVRCVYPKYVVYEMDRSFEGGPPPASATLTRQGRIVLDLSPASSASRTEAGNVVYDYTKKATFYLSAAELLYLSTAPFNTEEVAINKGGRPLASSEDAQASSGGGGDGSGGPNLSRSLSFRSIADRPGFWQLQIRSPIAGNTSSSTSASIVLSQSELVMLRHLFNSSIVWVTGWMQSINPSSFDPAIHLDMGGGEKGGGGMLR